MIIKRRDVFDASIIHRWCVYVCALVCITRSRARESVLQLLRSVFAATLIAVIVRVYREGIAEQPRAKVPREKGRKKGKGAIVPSRGRERRKTKAECSGVFCPTLV